MKINVHYRPERIGHTTKTYQKIRNNLADLGIHLRFKVNFDMAGDLPDLFLVQHDLLESEILERIQNVIVDERHDSATPKARHLLKSKIILGMLKVAALKEDFVNLAEARYHVRLLDKKFNTPKTPLSRPEIQKIHPGPSFLMNACALFDVGESEVDLSNWHNRAYDVVFAGRTSGYGSAIDLHRFAAYEALEALEKKYRVVNIGEKLLSRVEYVKLITNARIMISPWGDGETCVRDYEAMLAGCVLIKPNTEFATTIESIQAGLNYYSVELNWSNLEDILENIFSMSDSNENMRVSNLKVCKHWSDSQTISLWFEKTIRNLIHTAV